MQKQKPMPIQNKYLNKNVIYEAKVTTKNEIKQYVGSNDLKQGGMAMLEVLKSKAEHFDLISCCGQAVAARISQRVPHPDNAG